MNLSAGKSGSVAVAASRQSAQWAIRAETGTPLLTEDGNVIQPENAKPSSIQLTASKS